MRYQVFWVPEAEQELARIWAEATDRTLIASSAHLIDERLSRDPEREGESREEGRRIGWEPPLGVIFRVQAQERLVSVLNVWRFDKGRQID